MRWKKLPRIGRMRQAQNRAMRLNGWIGAVGYPCLELIWRGRTHPAMALAGGLSAALIRRCAGMRGRCWKKAFWAAAGITGIELGIGLLLNRRHQIWDYRGLPGNFRGQICPRYFGLWLLLARLFL